MIIHASVWKKFALSVIVAFMLTSWPLTGSAQNKDSNLERRVEALEKLARERGISNQALKRLIARQNDPNEMRVYFKNGLRLDSRDKRFKYQIGGRIQADVSFFDPDSRFKTSIEDTANGAEFRRARFFISGLLYNRVKFKAQYDFVGQTSFTDVYIGLIGIPVIGNVTVGHFKEPFSLEDLTSSKYFPFLETSLRDAFTPGRNLGIAIHDVLYDGRVTWAMGYFRPTGSAPPRIQSEDGGSFSARLTGVPIQRDKGRQLVHLGVGYNFRTSDDTISFSSKPESNQGPVTVDTGDIGSEDIYQLNFEAAVVLNLFRVQGEYTLVRVKQFTGLPDIDYHGGYVMVSYFLTGENQNYSKGVFGRISPKKNFMENGGWGALEAALRFSTIDLNDGSAGKLGGKENNYSAALNWYLNPHSRVMFNYVRAHVHGAPAADRGHLNIYALRFQVDF